MALHVELFPGCLPDVADKHVSISRIEAGSERIAQAVTKNLLFSRGRLPCEGIVGRDRVSAVVFNVDTQDFSEQGCRALSVSVWKRVAHTHVAEIPAIAATDVEIAFVARAGAKPDPIKIMIGLWLIGSDHSDFSRWVSYVGICADSEPRDVGYALVENSAIAGRVAHVEMTVGRVVRIKRHPENSGALALSDFGGNVEKWGRIDRSGWEIDDLNFSVLLCHKKPAGVPRRCTYVKREIESSCDSLRINVVAGAAG